VVEAWRQALWAQATIWSPRKPSDKLIHEKVEYPKELLTNEELSEIRQKAEREQAARRLTISSRVVKVAPRDGQPEKRPVDEKSVKNSEPDFPSREEQGLGEKQSEKPEIMGAPRKVEISGREHREKSRERYHKDRSRGRGSRGRSRERRDRKKYKGGRRDSEAPARCNSNRSMSGREESPVSRSASRSGLSPSGSYMSISNILRKDKHTGTVTSWKE
jgi:hypothetical protein